MKRLLPLLYILFLPMPAFPASVKSVIAKKRAVEVTPDEGETMEKGQTVCVFDEKEKKLGCGKVVKVKGSSVYVRVGKAVKKMKEGMPASVSVDSLNEGENAAAEIDPEASGSGSAKKKKGRRAKEKGKKPKKMAKRGGPPLRFWLDFGKSFAAPATYKKLSYAAPSNATPTTLWAADKSASDTTGANFQVGIPLAGFSLNPGVRYRTYTPSVVDADYVSKTTNPYVSTEQNGTAYGVFVDFGFLHVPIGSSVAFNASSGLDVDLSSVTVDAKKKTDNPTASPIEGSEKIASMTSKLTVISLRLGLGFDLLFLKVVGAHLALNGILPVSASGSVSGGFEDEEDRGVPDPAADLKQALAHTKNGFAAELLVGIVVAF